MNLVINLIDKLIHVVLGVQILPVDKHNMDRMNEEETAVVDDKMLWGSRWMGLEKVKAVVACFLNYVAAVVVVDDKSVN